MKNDEQKVLAELVQTVVTLDRGMDAMYMLLMKQYLVLTAWR